MEPGRDYLIKRCRKCFDMMPGISTKNDPYEIYVRVKTPHHGLVYGGMEWDYVFYKNELYRTNRLYCTGCGEHVGERFVENGLEVLLRENHLNPIDRKALKIVICPENTQGNKT